MGLWNNELNCIDLIERPFTSVVTLVNAMSREDIIEWLMWNDPNGIYADESSLKEFGNVMLRTEGIEILLRQVYENSVIT